MPPADRMAAEAEARSAGITQKKARSGMGSPRGSANPNPAGQEKAPLARAHESSTLFSRYGCTVEPRPIQDLLTDLGLTAPSCRRVLIVDDEFEVLAVLEALLDDEWDVTTAQGGVEALSILNSDSSIDLVITDQRMPEMTGVQLLQTVSASHPDLYRMVLTAYSDVDPIVAAINQGKVDQFVLKPWDPSSLRRLVAEGLAVCERRKTMQLIVERLHHLHDDHTSEIGHLKLLQGTIRAESWLNVAAWMGVAVAEEAEHLLLAAAPGLAGVDPAHEAKTSLSRAQTLREDLTRIAGGLESAAAETIGTRKIISDTVRLLVDEAGEASCPVHVEIDPNVEVIHVRVDPTRQALLCLLRNAQQASAEGEPIQVRVRRTTGEMVAVEVIDTGHGIDPDIIQQATKPFVSGFTPQSNGLGLSLCQQVAELHGGQLALLDNEPRGTIAQMWLRAGAS